MDIRSFFSPPDAKKKQNGTAKVAGAHGISKEKRGADDKKEKKQKQCREKKRPKSKRALVISESDEEEREFIQKKKKKTTHSNKKPIAVSDSDEEPLPPKIREAAKKNEKAAKSNKKSTYFDDSDDESPIKQKKSTTKKETPTKKEVHKKQEKTPEKKTVTSAADFFGSEPVHRSANKQFSGKRKQPSKEEGEDDVCATQDEPVKEEKPSQPSKKRKEEKSPAKKSPAKTALTLASKLSKAASAKVLVPETPPPKTPTKTTPSPIKKQVTPKKTTPVKALKEPESKKARTPEKIKQEETIATPSSLEKKKSGYRSFMSREGPKALGSKEIPQGAENCFEGLTFVVTGVLDSIERDHAQDLIQRYGGKVTGSVSKKTSYLLVGRDAGASKLSKAQTLGTKQLDEDAFLDLIRNTPGKKSKHEQPDTPSKQPKKAKPSKQQSPPASSQDQAENSQQTASQSSTLSPLTQTPTGSPVVKAEASLMWVDKYKPSGIKQIIGQQGDKSNMRKLLNWVRNWHKNRTKTHPKSSFFNKDTDGASLKAALLSGPPGVGKTTTATLVCQELGYSYVEMNASDARSKKTLEQVVSESLSNKSMDAFVGTSKGVAAKSGVKHVLLMDEVDGMAGSEDRGGMQELISLIKTSKIPIICMCNDRNSQKIRSLANYCFDLRFSRPRVEQIKGAMMSIAYKEGIKIPPPAMDQIIQGANQDIRQVLHNMSMWTATNKTLTYDQAKQEASNAQKDIKLGPFDAIRKLLSGSDSSKLSLKDKSDLFFCDYSLMPLFVQENYLMVSPSQASGDLKKTLDLVSRTADSICDGDLVSRQIRSNSSWSLLPMQAMLSAVIPSYFISGGMGQRIDFPQWLGKNSKQGRLDRILQELQAHMRISTSADKSSINLEYIPHLRQALTTPLTDQDPPDLKERVASVISLLDAYNLTREDWDSVMEAGLFDGHRDPMDSIPSKTKSAFTRTYNKEQHKTPYAQKAAPTKSRGKGGGGGGESEFPDEDGADPGPDEDEDDLEVSAMMVKNKKATAATGKGKTSKDDTGKGKGKGKGRGKKS
ncbi:replication factor C subunit 1 isoform X2 [Nematostella vectensis]|uniref:replication factor C subunit 1 isoform X2 n=1 Tax=Nematostella vectensis TaxID=45351 RepID=UPI0020775DC2|nr:replication factor C subunit 1 isoform X2 [Nematostella vectensis]